MTAPERRREIRIRVRDIAARYPRPVRMLTWADEQALVGLRAEHSALIPQSVAIKEMGKCP